MAEPITFQEGEKILLKLRKHWIILVRDTGATAALGLLPFFLFGLIGTLAPFPFGFSFFSAFGALVSSVWLLAIWMTLAIVWTDYYLDLWIVTDRRIISVDQAGLFRRTVTTLNLDDIQEITVHTNGPVQALLQFGSIEIETSGPDDEPDMEGIPNPEYMRQVILDQIHAARKAVEDAKGQKEVLRTASHEIKNYLAKDAAALASIADGDYAKHPEMLKNVASNALAQTRKGVDAVIQMLHADGTIVLNAAPFDLAASVQTISREYDVAARKKGLTFTVAASSPCIVNGDEEKLGRIVVKNLLDNALHYTPGGSIIVSVEKAGEVVRLTVADTGIGFDEVTKAKLFTPGGKGDDSSSINPESTGYGLSIVKELVETHKGRIWAESEGKGMGSRFIVELPAAQ